MTCTQLYVQRTILCNSDCLTMGQGSERNENTMGNMQCASNAMQNIDKKLKARGKHSIDDQRRPYHGPEWHEKQG
jgi:hypothetical protein